MTHYPPPPPQEQPQWQPMPPVGAVPGFAMGVDPYAPFGREPMTGAPYSSKSKVVAGLLQIFLGAYGIGRFYMGDTQTGAIQLTLTLVGWVTAIFGIGFLAIFAVSIWALVDGIILLTGRPVDEGGRPLRP